MDFTTKMISIALFAYGLGMATVLYAIAWVKLNETSRELREEYESEAVKSEMYYPQVDGITPTVCEAVKENYDNKPTNRT